MKLEINRQLLPVKAIYFFTLAGLACLIPFLPVYMHHLGLSAVEIGAIRGLEPFIHFIFCPLWGAVADKFNKHKPVLIGSLVASGVFLFVTLFIPPAEELNSISPNQDLNKAPLITVNSSANSTVITNNDISMEINCNSSSRYNILSAFCNDFYFYGDKSMAPLDTCPDICDASESLIMSQASQAQIQTEDVRTNSTDGSIENQMYDCHVCLQQRKQTLYLSEGFDYGSGVEIINPLFFQTTCHWDHTLSSKEHNSSWCSKTNRTHCSHSLHGSYLQTSTNSPECMQSYQCLCKPKPAAVDKLSPSDDSHTMTFILMLFFILFAKIFNCNVFPILDSTVMVLLRETRGGYSNQKVWGTVGWGLFALATGALIDGMSRNRTSVQFSAAFYLYLAFMLASACVAALIVFPPQPSSNPTLFLHSVGLLQHPSIVLFLVLSFVLGFSFGIIGTFLFLYLEELGSLYTLMGLTLTVACISEIPVFFFCSRLIKHLGHNGVLYLTLVCYAIRFLGYSFIRNPWLVIPLELLHGVTYGAAWATCSGYANICAPPGMAAHLQSLFTVTHMGLGKGIGTLLGGAMYHWLGGRNLFRISAGMCLLSALVFFLLQHYVIKKGLRYSRFHEICDGSDKLEESRDDSAPAEFDQCRLEIEESDFNSCNVDARAMQLALGTITEMPFPDSDDPSDPSGSDAIEMSHNGGKHGGPIRWPQSDSESSPPSQSDTGGDFSPGTSSLTELMKSEGRLPTIGREDSGGIEGADAVRFPAIGVEDIDDEFNFDDSTTLILPHGGKCTTV